MSGRRPARGLAWAIALWLVLPGLAAAQRAAPPASFAPVAAAARAATIVLRAPGPALEPAAAAGPADEAVPDLHPLDEDTELFQTLGERDERTLASGVVVDPRGLALTSARAVLGVPDFEVFLVDGTPVPAVLLGLDRRSDVALLKLDGGGVAMSYLPFGDSDRVATGEWVVAVGAPLGLEGTVTAGIVTATPTPASPSPFAALLQTDASMELGHAGGPIVTLDGWLVGLGTGLTGDSVSYVRPSTPVRRVYLELLERGRVSRPWLGVTTQPLTPELAEVLGGDGRGVLLADVQPDGPGALAGLRAGDIVLALDATRVSSRPQLDRAIGARAAGRRVTLTVRRAGGELQVAVRLGEEPDDWRLSPALARALRLLGIEARAITPTLGVKAARVEGGSPAALAGLAAGDIIREIDRRPIRTLAEFEAAVRSVDPRRPVLMQIQRGEVAVYVALPLRGRRD